VAYPFWEKTQKLGVKNVCVHKGLPLGVFNEEHCRPRDVVGAARDWPGLNFIVYHSGFRGLESLLQREDQQEIPWISDLLRDLKGHPEVKNVYFELGSTFNQLSAYAPQACMHMLGQMIQVAGADRVLWGTDSIWSGSPQSQIERLRRLRISDDLIAKHGYPQLTPEIKRQIFGLNAARLFGVDPAAKRREITHDRLSQLRRDYLKDPRPSNTQYGWVWEDDAGAPPQLPIQAT
jgi:predicted TIM-barrel fold metal-dependent hydrolase